MAHMYVTPVDSPTAAPGNADIGVQYRANATGAATIGKVQSAATTNATLLKGSGGRMLGFTLSNTTAAFKFVHFHNKAGAPVPGTDSPAYTLAIPPNSVAIRTMEGGAAYPLGIGYSITGAAGDLDATVVAANDVVGAIYFA